MEVAALSVRNKVLNKIENNFCPHGAYYSNW